MVENNTSVEYNLDENSDSEGYRNEDKGDNESIVPDSDPNSLDIEVLSVGSSEVSSDHTDFEVNWMTMDLTLLMMLLSLPMQTLLTSLTSLIESFTQDSGPCLPKYFHISVATALDYFNLLFKPEIFSDIKDQTSNHSIFKQEEGRKPQLKN